MSNMFRTYFKMLKEADDNVSVSAEAEKESAAPVKKKFEFYVVTTEIRDAPPPLVKTMKSAIEATATGDKSAREVATEKVKATFTNPAIKYNITHIIEVD
jgi:hypothetical protein